MELIYSGKKSEKEVLELSSTAHFSNPYDHNNTLINGNNLEVLSILLHEYKMYGKVDLIYIA